MKNDLIGCDPKITVVFASYTLGTTLFYCKFSLREKLYLLNIMLKSLKLIKIKTSHFLPQKSKGSYIFNSVPNLEGNISSGWTKLIVKLRTSIPILFTSVFVGRPRHQYYQLKFNKNNSTLTKTSFELKIKIVYSCFNKA